MELQKNNSDKRMKEKLEQKIKWILRRRQRLEYQLQNDEQRKNFNSKFEHILGKIREILKNSAPAGGWADHSFKQQMRQYYYGNEEKQTVKIRVTIRPGQLFRHSFVTLGNEYEYDYLGKYAPRRRIFKKWIDEKLDENNEQKEAKPIEGLEKFSVTEADTIFFDMPKKGWIPSNHDRRKMRNCTSFVYEFIFHLNGGKCPAEEKWPQPFLDVDEKTPTIAELYLNHKMVSVFSEEYANNYRQKFIKREEEGSKECALKELEIQILMIKGEKWRLMEQKGKKVKEENEKSNAQMLLPAIVVYDTGRFYNFRHYTTEERNCPFDFTEPLNIQEHLVKETETAEAILYSALLKVNLCKVDGMPRAFVNNLFLLDSKMEYLVHEFGGANLFEENSGGHHLFKYEFGETQQEKMNDINKLCGIYRDEMIMKQKIEN